MLVKTLNELLANFTTAPLRDLGTLDGAFMHGSKQIGHDIAPEVLYVVAGMALGAALLLMAWMWTTHERESARARAWLLEPELAEPPTERESTKYTNVQLMALTCPTMAYSCTAATLAFMLLPDEARAFPYESSWTLGLLFVVGGLAELPGPLLGHMSDCLCSPYGRRRPFIILAALMVIGATSVQWLGALQKSLITYAAALLVQMISWALLYTAEQGLILDMLTESQVTIASSFQAIFVATGACIAFGVAIVMPPELHWHFQYAVTAVMTVVTSAMAVMVYEPPSTGHDVAEAETSFYGLVKRFYFLDFERQKNFSYVLVSKALMIGGGVAKGYLIFWLRDTWNVTDTRQLHRKVGCIVVAAELTACATAGILLVAGEALSPNKTAIWGTMWICVTWMIMIPLGFMDDGYYYAEIFAVTYGIGHGLVLVGDQALTLHNVPEKAHGSRSIGMQCVATFVGMSFFSMMCSLLLDVFGRVWNITIPGSRHNVLPPDGYRLEGYLALFAFVILANIYWGYVYSRIGVKTRKHGIVDEEQASS